MREATVNQNSRVITMLKSDAEMLSGAEGNCRVRGICFSGCVTVSNTIHIMHIY